MPHRADILARKEKGDWLEKPDDRSGSLAAYFRTWMEQEWCWGGQSPSEWPVLSLSLTPVGQRHEKSKTYYFLDCSPWHYFAVVFQSCHRLRFFGEQHQSTKNRLWTATWTNHIGNITRGTDQNQAVINGNQKILIEFYKWLAKEGLSAKMQHEHHANVRVFVAKS